MMIRYGFGVAIVAAVAWAPASRGDDQAGAENLTLVLKLRSDRIGPIEPLQMQVTLTNAGRTGLDGLAHWGIRSSTSVEVLTPGHTTWTQLEVPYLNRLAGKCGSFQTPPLMLGAGESVSAGLSVIYDPFESYAQDRAKYYFGQPGQYAVRARYETGKGRVVVSNELLFRVDAYTGADAVAYEWLKTRPMPHFMYDPDVYTQNSGRETVDDAREVMQRFPDSRFAAPARLYLARCYLIGLRHGPGFDPPNLDRASDLAAGLVRSDDPDVRRAAQQVLDEIKSKLGTAASQPSKSKAGG